MSDINDVNPDWIEDGFGVQGEQHDSGESGVREWDINAYSSDSQDAGNAGGRSGVEVACESTGDFAEGETLVSGVTKITFNSDYFKIHDNGGGEVQVSLKTTDCAT